MTIRQPFIFPTVLPSWHLGHMVKATRDMRHRLGTTDVVIETRDARLPLTSINPAFEQMFRGMANDSRPSNSIAPVRMIVYNKTDLADLSLVQPLREAFAKHGQTVFFTNSRIDTDVQQVLRHAKEAARPGVLARYGRPNSADEPAKPGKSRSHSRSKVPPDPARGIKIMFCGMPNVGKSSLLNALRRVGCHKGKAASEAPMPGHTRSIGGMVKVADGSSLTASWPVYAFDTPGIMPPYLGQGAEAGDRAFKIALTAGIKESLFDAYDLAAYLFHSLLIRHSSPSHALAELSKALTLPATFSFPETALDPCQPLPTEHLLFAVANRIKAVEPGGKPDLEAAAQWMLKCFRDGRFGGWTLDDVGQHSNFLESGTDHKKTDFKL